MTSVAPFLFHLCCPSLDHHLSTVVIAYHFALTHSFSSLCSLSLPHDLPCPSLFPSSSLLQPIISLLLSSLISQPSYSLLSLFTLPLFWPHTSIALSSLPGFTTFIASSLTSLPFYRHHALRRPRPASLPFSLVFILFCNFIHIFILFVICTL